MKWLPRTLFGQILLALLAGLLAAQVLGGWLMLDDRARLTQRLLGAYAAQRIAGIISLLDDADPEERVRLVQALDVPPTRISLDQPWQAAGGEVSEETEAFALRLAADLDRPLPLQVLSIRRAPWERVRSEWKRLREAAAGAEAGRDARGEKDWWRRRGGRSLQFVVAQAKLGDGAVVTFRQALPEPPADRPLRVLGWLALTGISVALLAAWAVRRLTRPLTRLSEAASGLARNLDQAPVPETGPLEVSRAAGAFNAMQRELRRYLETRAQALAGVSHDLRLPIARLRLRVEGLTDAELKSSIEGDLAEMDTMIGNTLEFLRAGSTAEELVKVNVNALLDGVAEDMEALGARVRRQGEARTPLWARPQALRRCLTNLLDNARRYGGGEMDVSVRDLNKAVEIRIEDRGPGIPEAELERVFEPYVRLESSRAKHTGGTGLGLAIARTIARSHGGEIKLERRPGGGLSAILILPRVGVQSDSTGEP